MTGASSQLGQCPFCGSVLKREALILKYETADETRVFVECDDCQAPVEPEEIA